MKESVFSSGIRGVIPYAPEEPARAIAPGLNGMVWGYHADRAEHLDHKASGNLLFVHNTAAVNDAGGTVVRPPLSPAGMAIRLPSGLHYRHHYSMAQMAIAATMRGLTSSRYPLARV
jgi:hypothetical protein